MWTNFAGAVAVVCAITGAASPLAEVAKSWPVHTAFNKPRVESNAARLARGLSPLSPARLYDPERVHSAPKARLSSAGQPPSGAGEGYGFLACYAGINSGTFDFITATDDNDALNQCATFAAGKSATTFALAYAGYGYECEAGATGNGAAEQCTTNDWAVYTNAT